MAKYFKPYIKEMILAPLFKLLEAILELLIPIIVTKIINQGIKLNDTSYILKMGLLMILCGFLGLIFSLIGQYFAAKVAVFYAKDVRKELFIKINKLDFKDIDHIGISTFITRITNDVNQVQNGINLTLRLFLRSPFIVVGAAICALIINPKLSIIFFIIIPILFIITFFLMLITLKKQYQVQKEIDKVLSLTKENITGVRVIRGFNIENDEINNYDTTLKTLKHKQKITSNISSLLNPLTYALINVAIISLLYFGYFDVINNITEAAIIVALYNYMSQILVELIKLANLIIQLTKAIASSKRIKNILDIVDDEEILDKEYLEDKAYIEFDHVSFSYNNNSNAVLDDINIKINKGECIGLIGLTGSGKTSMVSLLNRSYEVSNGNLYFDGYNIKSYDKKTLRNKISIVLQKSILFKGTIKDNMLVACSNATDEEIKNALLKAKVSFINDLSDNVEAYGSNFSGGERQRLSIARSLLKNPDVLILDDSSSALDYKTEQELRSNLNKLHHDKTIIIISERATFIRNCDKVIVLDDGKVVGFDTPDNLLQNNELYQDIYYTSFKKEVK